MTTGNEAHDTVLGHRCIHRCYLEQFSTRKVILVESFAHVTQFFRRLLFRSLVGGEKLVVHLRGADRACMSPIYQVLIREMIYSLA